MEQYVKKPAAVQVFALNGATDIILRKDLIKTYDRENALFYCDPPYFETEKYYRARFQESDHKRLADALHSIKGRFLLSYNDCPQVRELYADCIIEPVSRRNTLSAQSVDGYKEVLVRNYEL